MPSVKVSVARGCLWPRPSRLRRRIAPPETRSRGASLRLLRNQRSQLRSRSSSTRRPQARRSRSTTRPPPQPGQMTAQAAQAKRLFDGEKWSDAALALYKVYKGETGDDEGNKQLAQYHLAISLYRLKFYQAAYAYFSEISDKHNHLKFNETLLWLSKLATDLPEPADIVERVGKYNDEQIGRFNNPNQRDLFWQLNYLLGRYKYRNRQYEDALRLFAKVDRRSKYYVQAQFFSGISNVQLRRSVPPCSHSSASSARSMRESKASRTRRACETSHTCRWRGPITRLHHARREQRSDGQGRQALGSGEVLEQGRRRERVLARRSVRGELGLLHGWRLLSRAGEHPHARGPLFSRSRTIRRRVSSRRSSTSPTASTRTRQRSSRSSSRSISRYTMT